MLVGFLALAAALFVISLIGRAFSVVVDGVDFWDNGLLLSIVDSILCLALGAFVGMIVMFAIPLANGICGAILR